MEKKISEKIKVTIPDAEEMEEIKLNRVDEAIKNWYSITQSTMKILFDLKQSKAPMNDNQRDIFNKNLAAFGWFEIQDKKELVEKPDHLDDVDSPYYILSNEFKAANMAHKRRKEATDNALKGLKAWLEKSKEKVYEQTIDASGGIGDLYRASDYISRKAKADIDEFPILKDRYDELYGDLRNIGGSFSKDEYVEGFVEAFIMRAIDIGYAAGMNAQVTEMWRKTKQNEASEDEMTIKEYREKHPKKAPANKKVTKNNKK